MAEIVIRSEDDAWALISNLVASSAPVSKPDRIVVDGWNPTLLYFRDEPVDGSLSRHSARAIADYYERIERIYALVSHGEPNRRKLSEEDKEILDGIRIAVGEGSSILSAVDKIIEAFVNGMVGKMTDEQILLIALVTVVGLFGRSMFLDWVKERAATKRVEIEALNRLSMSQEETKRAEIMASVVTKAPIVKRIEREIDGGHEALVRSLASSNNAEVHDVQIPGPQARKLVSSERQKADGRRLDGRFKVIDINNEPEEAYRIRFERLSDGWKFDALAGSPEVADEDMENLFWALRAEQELEILANATYSADGKVQKAFVVRANKIKEDQA